MAAKSVYTLANATTALNELTKLILNSRKVLDEYRGTDTNERKNYEKRHKKYWIDFAEPAMS